MKDKSLIPEIQRFRKLAGLITEARELIYIDELPEVSLEFRTRLNTKTSTIRRGGPGFEGNYEQLKDKLTNYSRQATEDVARRLGITWSEMIVYYSGRNKLFAIVGRDNEGRYYMYDRYGTGMGAYSKIRPESGPAENVQTFLGGNRDQQHPQ